VRDASLAQSVEQLIRNEQVVGSSPTTGSSFWCRSLSAFFTRYQVKIFQPNFTSRYDAGAIPITNFPTLFGDGHVQNFKFPK
jgi:hypothetical protein